VGSLIINKANNHSLDGVVPTVISNMNGWVLALKRAKERVKQGKTLKFN